MTKRVLIVEDEIFTALDLEDELLSHGYEVVGIAADRKEALRLADRADVALVDVNLRDGPTGVGVGVTLAREYGVQVLFLTANPAMVAERAPDAVGCLGKPCERGAAALPDGLQAGDRGRRWQEGWSTVPRRRGRTEQGAQYVGQVIDIEKFHAACRFGGPDRARRLR